MGIIRVFGGMYRVPPMFSLDAYIVAATWANFPKKSPEKIRYVGEA